MASDADLRAWAERAAPTLTDEDWKDLERGMWFTASYSVSKEERAALLAYVDELARWLDPWVAKRMEPTASGVIDAYMTEEVNRGLLSRDGAYGRRVTPLGSAVLRARARLGLG